MIRAYLLHAILASCSVFAPVTTNFPVLKMRAVVLGVRIRIVTAGNRFGLYSMLRACVEIYCKSREHPSCTVHTMFCIFTETDCISDMMGRDVIHSRTEMHR